MENYDCFSDEELQRSAAAGDARAEEALAQRYSDLVELCARPYFLVGGENADLRQEGMVGLVSAIRRYDPGQSIPFRTFAETCIRHQIFSAIKSAARLKHTPLNQGVSLEEDQPPPSRETSPRLVPDQRRTLEEQVLARESTKDFFQSFQRLLSEFEQSVLYLYLDGYSYQDMAKKLGRDDKSIDNAVQRIRKKLARILFPGDISES